MAGSSSRGELDADDLFGDEPDVAPARRRRTRRRSGLPVKRLLIGFSVLTLVLAVAVAGGGWYLTQRYAGNIDRVTNVFEGLDETERPAPATPADPAAVVADPVTFLLVGSTPGRRSWTASCPTPAPTRS